MLPTKETIAGITMYHDGNFNNCKLSTNHDKLQYHSNQHLYIISDDEINIGDWCVVNKSGIRIYDKTQFSSQKKIIATTNKSLCIEKTAMSADSFDQRVYTYKDYLPELPQHFIKEFINEWNKGNVIKEVVVECELRETGRMKESKFNTAPDLECTSWSAEKDMLPVINTDNTVNINIINKFWNRDEVIEILNKLAYDLSGNGLILDSNLKVNNKWIEENL